MLRNWVGSGGACVGPARRLRRCWVLGWEPIKASKPSPQAQQPPAQQAGTQASSASASAAIWFSICREVGGGAGQGGVRELDGPGAQRCKAAVGLRTAARPTAQPCTSSACRLKHNTLGNHQLTCSYSALVTKRPLMRGRLSAEALRAGYTTCRGEEGERAGQVRQVVAGRRTAGHTRWVGCGGAC